MNGPWRSCDKQWKSVTRDEAAGPTKSFGCLPKSASKGRKRSHCLSLASLVSMRLDVERFEFADTSLKRVALAPPTLRQRTLFRNVWPDAGKDPGKDAS